LGDSKQFEPLLFQSDRVPPGKSVVEEFNGILDCISKLSATTIADVNK